jgi:RNA polymerase primary sigma factor
MMRKPEQLYNTLQTLGIEIPSEEDEEAESNLELEEPDFGSDNAIRARIANEIIVDDDPVHTYLREIGRVQLLTSEQEVWLSTQLSASDVLAELTNEAVGSGVPFPRATAHVRNYEQLLLAWDEALIESQEINVDLPDLSSA